MEKSCIHDVKVIPLRQIHDERGKVMHMLREDDEHFEKFGEIYFSCVEPGKIKGWHLHKEMTLNYAVVSGSIKLVIYDDREDSTSRYNYMELYLGRENYQLVIIPPGLWNGFKGLGNTLSIVANCATMPHDPEELLYESPYGGAIEYDWEKVYD